MTQFDARASSVVGDRTGVVLADALGIETVGDLLLHLPRRYARRGELSNLGELPIDEQVTVMAEVAKVHSRRMQRRRGSLLEVVVTDGSGSLSLSFFNQNWREKDLRVGARGLFSGKVTRYQGKRQLTHPDYLMLDAEDDTDAEAFSRALVPLYPASSRLPSWRVAKCVRMALAVLPDLNDPLPAEVRSRQGLPGWADAIRMVHQPEEPGDPERGRERLAFDEAFAAQVVIAQRRAATAATAAVARPYRDDGLLAAFDESLPFELTTGQRAVSAEIEQDLSRPHPMHRLLQGEVGSGKTVVALRAMLAVVDSGGQAALLAPTEVLAAQHARGLRDLLGPLGQAGTLGAAEGATSVGLLTGSLTGSARRDTYADIRDGRAGIVVGTHALFTEQVEFADLGLVVIDEQHRFGVEQREALRAKAASPPHVLVMTATPIPRTVAMTVFGDLDVSTLAELPAGRSPIATHVVDEAEQPRHAERVWQRVVEEVRAGRQAFVVAPRIGADEPEDVYLEGAGAADSPADADGADAAVPAASVLAAYEQLRAGPLAGLRLGLLHGRLSADEKDSVMRDFVAGALDVLVATTVIEVGVDVPNATVMVVLDADRFGVSQLHQLRGRVGRGGHAGLCLLLTRRPGEAARRRLDAVAATLDGFELAAVDLAERREGDVLGQAQSGRRSSLRLVSVLRDGELIARARAEATDLVAADPELTWHPEVAAAVERLLGERAEFLDKS